MANGNGQPKRWFIEPNLETRTTLMDLDILGDYRIEVINGQTKKLFEVTEKNLKMLLKRRNKNPRCRFVIYMMTRDSRLIREKGPLS